MKIIYTHKAVDDLQRLYKFIVKDNLKAAVEVSLKLRQAIDRLKDFPLMGKEVKRKLASESIRDLITANYIIRYVVLKNEIHILRIWHSKEDLRYKMV